MVGDFVFLFYKRGGVSSSNEDQIKSSPIENRVMKLKVSNSTNASCIHGLIIAATIHPAKGESDNQTNTERGDAQTGRDPVGSGDGAQHRVRGAPPSPALSPTMARALARA